MHKKHIFWLLPLLAAILILCLACGSDNETQVDASPRTGEQVTSETTVVSDEISIVTPEPDAHRDELDAILKRTTMLEGVKINGVDVSGMTKEEAKAAVQPSLEDSRKAYRIDAAFGDVSASFSGETIAVSDDLDAAINEAFSIVREDNGYEAVSAEVAAIKANGRDFPVTLSFDEKALRSAVNAFADAHEVSAVDASVGYNKNENKIDFVADIPGRSIDREALFAALLDAKSGETVNVPAKEITASVTLADIQSKYVLRGTYTTKFAKSIKNRKFNICKGAGMITGTVLHPGDTFSANGTLGVRKKANGWKEATAYVQGAHEKQYGGGVCQLSSTLYNAAVLADMKIVKRQNHSMPVDYVHKGLDATINSVGNPIDFKFQNSSKSDIIIIAYVDNKDYAKATTLTMEIWGVPISEDSNGAYDEIRIPTPVKTKTIKPSGDVEYRLDETKPVGYKELSVKNQNGSVWESTKEYYLNGVLVKSEKLATSTYKAYSKVYIVGPSPEPTASPSSTPKPDPTPTHSDPTPTHSDPTPTHSDPTPTHSDPTPAPDTPKPDTPNPDTPKPDTPKPDTPKPDTPKPDPTEPSSGDGGEG